MRLLCIALTLINTTSAFSIRIIRPDSQYNNRTVNVLPAGGVVGSHLTIDGGTPADFSISGDGMLFINNITATFDQGGFLYSLRDINFPGKWSIEGDHVLFNNHAGFIVCPEHWFGIAYAGVSIPITCDDAVEVILGVYPYVNTTLPGQKISYGAATTLLHKYGSSITAGNASSSSLVTFNKATILNGSSSTNNPSSTSKNKAFEYGISGSLLLLMSLFM